MKIKKIIILLMFIISLFFMFITNQNLTIDHISTALLFFFCLFDYILIQLKNKHHTLSAIYVISFVTIVILFYHLYYIISTYSSSIDFSWYYLLIITIWVIDAFIFKKTKNDSLNNILMIIVCFFIILIHIRYYLEPHFIHHLMHLTNWSSFGVGLQDSYLYVTQYYPCFTIILIILIIHQKIFEFGIKKCNSI